ncbi:MAG: hypothetical protein M3Q27_18870 [Actinomycetota bacterium]|nr:hypothetical protein [Actinomycetota bacterium]
MAATDGHMPSARAALRRTRAGRAAHLRGRALGAVTTLAALVCSTVMWEPASAAFTARTSNVSNQLTAGTVVLADDDSGGALFSASNLKPGSMGERCIAVTYSGSLTATVKVFRTGTSGGLSPYLDITVEEGTGGSASSCTGFAPSLTVYAGTLASLGTSFAAGSGAWAPAGGSSTTRVYRISYIVAANSAAKSQSVTTTFTWEARS